MRRLSRSLVVIGAITIMTLALGTAQAEVRSLDCHRDHDKYPVPRQALVVGNSAYQQTMLWPALGEAPENDAVDIADRLCSIGFEVTLGLNLGKELKDTLLNFASTQPSKGVRLFYFSGHGVQNNNTNFLMPVDAIGVEDGVVMEDVFGALDGNREGNPDLSKIIILDACRTNAAQISKAGLAQPYNAVTGALVAYATAPDSVATTKGTDNRHSLYTEALLQNLGVPGMTTERLFTLARSFVYKHSEHKQTPWETLSSLEAFQFEPPLKIDPVEVYAPDPDDLLIVTVRNTPVAKSWREGGGDNNWKDITQVLQPGDNPFFVELYNQKSRTGGIPGFLGGGEPEGWNYSIHFKIMGQSVQNLQYSDGEKVAFQKRWGMLFRVMSGTITVDPKSGRVQLKEVKQFK